GILAAAKAEKDAMAKAAGDRVRERQKRIQDIEDEANKKKDAIDDENKKRQEAREQDKKKEKEADQKAIDDAKKALEDALFEEALLKAEVLGHEPRKAKGPGTPMERALEKVDVAGTFSALAIRGLGAATTTDKLGQIAQNTGNTVKELQDLKKA